MLQNEAERRPPLHFSNINILLAFGHLVKTYRFVKNSLAAVILRETCKGGLFCFILQHTYKVTLNKTLIFIFRMLLDKIKKTNRPYFVFNGKFCL